MRWWDDGLPTLQLSSEIHYESNIRNYSLLFQIIWVVSVQRISLFWVFHWSELTTSHQWFRLSTVLHSTSFFQTSPQASQHCLQLISSTTYPRFPLRLVKLWEKGGPPTTIDFNLWNVVFTVVLYLYDYALTTNQPTLSSIKEIQPQLQIFDLVLRNIAHCLQSLW